MSRLRTLGAGGLLLVAGASLLSAAIDLARIGLNQPLDPALRPALEPVPDLPGLPRVLLLGDSISIGYTREVRSLLAGRANVHRAPENCGPVVYGLERLESWLGSGPWDVIHFNFGLHDLKFLDAAGNYIEPGPSDRPLATIAEYERDLSRLVARLRATGARLIFATTTPVPAGTVGRVAGSEVAYNAAARRVMDASGVGINDLAAFAAGRPGLQRPRNVHFTAAGCEALAGQVAATIRAALAP